MDQNCLTTVASLRLIVGILGEKEQHGWWASSFFAVGSDSFLFPLFPKTSHIARLTGVTAAAAALHDARIGQGNAYHLFRLPEEQEYALSRLLQNDESAFFANTAMSARDAQSHLLATAAPGAHDAAGPVRIGGIADIHSSESWSLVAAFYAAGFNHEQQIFPYFSGAA